MYRPLPKYLTIKPSNIEGLGLFTTEDVEKGRFMSITHYRTPEFGLIRTPAGGFINHDPNPNCYLLNVDGKDSGFSYLVSLRDIKAGEEITLKYEHFSDPSEFK